MKLRSDVEQNKFGMLFINEWLKEKTKITVFKPFY